NTTINLNNGTPNAGSFTANGDVFLGTGIGTTVTINTNVAGAGDGTVTFNGRVNTVNTSPDQALSIIAGTGAVSFSGATGGITLVNSVTLNSDANGGGTGGLVNLTGSAVNATGATVQSLAITAGSGAVSLATIGNTVALGGVSVTNTGPT